MIAASSESDYNVVRKRQQAFLFAAILFIWLARGALVPSIGYSQENYQPKADTRVMEVEELVERIAETKKGLDLAREERSAADDAVAALELEAQPPSSPDGQPGTMAQAEIEDAKRAAEIAAEKVASREETLKEEQAELAALVDNKLATTRELQKVGDSRFAGFGFGVAIALTIDTGGRDRVAAAGLVGSPAVVAVQDDNNTRANFMLESHYFFTPDGQFLWVLGPENQSGRVTPRKIKEIVAYEEQVASLESRRTLVDEKLGMKDKEVKADRARMKERVAIIGDEMKRTNKSLKQETEKKGEDRDEAEVQRLKRKAEWLAAELEAKEAEMPTSNLTERRRQLEQEKADIERLLDNAQKARSRSYLPPKPQRQWGFGPFVGILPGSDNIIEAVGFGMMIGFRRALVPGLDNVAPTLGDSFNIGFGGIVDPNAAVLAKGFIEGQPPPNGETTVRLRNTTQWGLLLIFSYSF